MSSGNGAPRRFTISMSDAHRELLHEFHRQHDEMGNGTSFVAAFREVIRRLRHAPRVFGERLFTLPALKLEMRQAAIDPLVVTYGVHEEKPIVFVQGFKLLG